MGAQGSSARWRAEEELRGGLEVVIEDAVNAAADQLRAEALALLDDVPLAVNRKLASRHDRQTSLVEHSLLHKLPSPLKARLADDNMTDNGLGTAWIDALDPVFGEIADAWMAQLVQDFGTDHWYQVDGYFNGDTAPWRRRRLREADQERAAKVAPPALQTSHRVRRALHRHRWRSEARNNGAASGRRSRLNCGGPRRRRPRAAAWRARAAAAATSSLSMNAVAAAAAIGQPAA